MTLKPSSLAFALALALALTALIGIVAAGSVVIVYLLSLVAL